VPCRNVRPTATAARDTDLVVEVERDLTIYGEEVKSAEAK
jgi:urease alpha subunit